LGNTKKAKTSTISFFDLLIVIAKRWKMIFFTSLGAAIFILLFSIGSIVIASKWGPEKSYLPNVYKPKVIILFQEDQGGLSSLMGGGGDLLSLMGGSINKGSKAKLAEVLLYRNQLLDQVIEELHVKERYEIDTKESRDSQQQARKVVHEAISCNISSADNTMEISYQHTNAWFAEKMVIRIVELLEIQYKQLALEKKREDISFLDESILKAELEMNEKLKDLTEFQKKNKIIDPLKQIEMKSQSIAAIEQDITMKKLKMEKIASYKGYDDPQVKQVQEDIRRSKRAFNMLLEGDGTKSKYNVPISRLIELGPEYNKLTEELNGLRQLYINLKVQQQAKLLEKGNNTSTFQIIQTSNFFKNKEEDEQVDEFPQKAGPSRGKLCLLFTFAIFFLSVFSAFVLEFMEQIKLDPEESEKLETIKNLLPNLSMRGRKK